MVYKIFDKKFASLNESSGSGIVNKANYQLANEFHKPIIKKFKQRKVYSSFRGNIWGVDLADMQSLSKYSKGIKYLLCAIDLFNKYSIVNAIQKILSDSNRKPNKILADQGSGFYNNSFRDFLKIKKIEMYSTYKEGKSLLLKDLLEL